MIFYFPFYLKWIRKTSSAPSYKITTTILNIRMYPGIPEDDNNIITKLPKGSLLQIIEHKNNGKYINGYHWWYMKFGIIKGWCAGEYLEEYDLQEQQPETLKDVILTVYHVCLESEMAEGQTIADPQGITGTFYKKFLYSAKGVVMQGSGQAIDGKTIKYVSGGGGWINKDGQPTFLCKDGSWSNGPPFWIANEQSVVFEELPQNTYKGTYGDVYPWYSIAVDPSVIPIGSIVYIEILDGWKLKNGEILNGYFMAVDTGPAIKENHIDIFVGAGEIALKDWWDIQKAFKEKIDPETGNIKTNIIYDDSTQWSLKKAKLKSPGELRVYDSVNQITGVVNGEVKNCIPKSSYDYIINAVIIVLPTDYYRYEVVGIGNGTYGLEIISMEKGVATTFNSINIPISATAIHEFTINWTSLSQGEEGVTIKIDNNGDGIFEYIFTSDSELTYSEYIDATTEEIQIINGYELFILVGSIIGVGLATTILKKKKLNF